MEIYLPKRNIGQGIRDKDRRYRTRERGKGTRERKEGYLCRRRTKDCLWTERRETWHVEK